MVDLEKRIRSFLVASPRPTRIVVKCAEEEHELGPAKAGTSWAGIARSIMALKPESVQVFIGERLERAMECDEKPDERVSVAIPSALTTDPETARVTHFANLIHRAYEHTTNVAFERICELFEMQSNRAIAMEQRLERMEMQYRNELRRQLEDERETLEEQLETAAAQQSHPLHQLASAFMSGVQQQQAQSSNGAPKS
jgi:hypothetical protein